MAQFTVNAKRFDPYKNFKFRIKWDGKYVAGVSKVNGLKRTRGVVKHREGGEPSSSRKSPGRTEYDAITLDRGVTHDAEPDMSGVRQRVVGALRRGFLLLDRDRRLGAAPAAECA